ncbi:hypothetical protein [Cryobacterium sp. TMT1-19]|uniref:hypothetical protein n=1 Tax=Cryobacterium sp. TMT1-19 TaxID=1259231 RepID=UPI00141B99E3|nr:hypothetical protein [Cryobacterium sp. TMT1-19]
MMKRTETLVGPEGELWIVTTTHGTTHRFDLDAMTVTRRSGPGSAPTVNDQARPLIEIVRCTVGETGYWTMKPDIREADLLEYRWHLSTQILSIEPAPADPPAGPGS